MQWNNSYSVGNDKLDFQHQELISMTNKLQQSLRQGITDKDIIETLKFIVSYTRYHFDAEEEFMTQIKCPELKIQKQLHADILKQVSDIFVDLKDGKMINCFELVTFLTDWVVDHIIVEDGKIGAYVNANKDKLALASHEVYIKKQADEILTSIDKVKSFFNRGLINANDFREGKGKILKAFISERTLKNFYETCEILDWLEKERIISDSEKYSFLLNMLPTKDIERTISEIGCVDGKLRSINLLAKTSTISEEQYDKYISEVLGSL